MKRATGIRRWTTGLAGLMATAVTGLASGAAIAPPKAATAAAPNMARSEPPIKGYAVAIGGALKTDNEEVWSRIVTLAGGKGARFVVFGTASEDPEGSARHAIEHLQRRGAVAEALPVAPLLGGVDLKKAVSDEALIRKVRAAQGIYFTGGSQERIVDTLLPGGKPTPILDAIWDVYRKGGVVAGTSAGAAVMSTVMFRDAPSVLSVLKGQWEEGQQIDRGLGFVGPELFVDQHFLVRGRFGRMIPLMMAKGYKMGLGVDENTAAVVHGDEVEIIGGRGALLVDLQDMHTDPARGVFNLKNARLSYLDHGDRYNTRTRETLPSPAKLRGDKYDPAAPDYKPYQDKPLFYADMLGNSVIVNAMSYLIDSNQSEVKGLGFAMAPLETDTQPQLGFLFRVYKGPGSLGYSSDESGAEEFTVMNLYLDITPVRMPQPLYSDWPLGGAGAK